MKLTITKELEDIWGIKELISDMKDESWEAIESAIIELLYEDVSELLNNTTWELQPSEEERKIKEE